MSWITFDLAGTSESGKTKEWRVQPKDRPGLAACVGIVKWYGPWRKYTFTPYSHTVFEQDCLRDIADFCEQRTKDHKAAPLPPLDQEACREAAILDDIERNE